MNLYPFVPNEEAMAIIIRRVEVVYIHEELKNEKFCNMRYAVTTRLTPATVALLKITFRHDVHKQRLTLS
jgi:hypothetical protein